jgi:hypothetical protein
MNKVKIFDYTGDFAENKDSARNLRITHIEPELKQKGKIILDFKGVTSATQSFIHALISQTIRTFGVDILNEIEFKNCESKVQTIIEIVVDYVQDGIFTEDDMEEDR